MKIIFMGTPVFAVPSLKALTESEDEVIAAVCQPDKPVGRKKILSKPPTKEFAESQNIPVLQPAKIRGNDEFLNQLKELAPDLICVAAYGKILPKEVLDLPKYGCINVHSSLLPKYRGAAPINWAIINGEAKTGVTTMLMDEGMDTGDILLTEETDITTDDTSETLTKRLSEIGADLLIKTIIKLKQEELNPIKQLDNEATLAPILKKEHGEIDWTKSAEEIRNQIRGLLPWPVAFTHLNGKMLKIFSADTSEKSGDPGLVLEASKSNLRIACGFGSLDLKELQLEGNKKMEIKSFVAGRKIESGTRLG
ncbi:MAG: methionyl-tRNA formyltransferase [Candidatus Dadabacteria bacterium]|nr:methionyl-tRNA formyltransferase [Candidatus Dadabacteria bacterium]NIV42521.1 methionyl-tRNA formyltransferase [Candidatus Dadabacteria bacterium]